MALFTNVTFVLSLLIKVAILCSVDLLRNVCKNCITETTQVTESCKYFPRGMHAARRLHVGQHCNTVSQKHSGECRCIFLLHNIFLRTTNINFYINRDT